MANSCVQWGHWGIAGTVYQDPVVDDARPSFRYDSGTAIVSAQHVIVGTAGHIDHGKTSLIRALTGVETDRLPEEKKRGITIVLGFAPLVLPNGRRIGVVDVPGHERFVKNMVAGAGGIDIALMVVAADEGVMPQTREHLEICELLGIQRGLIALTKVDRAADLVELAIEDVRSEMASSFLADADIVPCSSQTGEGIDTLRQRLAALIETIPARADRRAATLPIDRTFTKKGFGSVVTGTLTQGRLRVGDAVQIVPPIPGRAVDGDIRVRGLQVFKENVDVLEAGQRAAVNLQGVALDQLRLGQLVITPDAALPTRRLSVALRHLSSRSKPLKTGAKLLLHAGTALVQVGVTLLDTDALEPGQSGLATFRLVEPMVVMPGQRFILRGFETSQRAGRTIAGGQVLDPEPGRRRRKHPDVIARLESLREHLTHGPEEGRLEAALVAIVEEAGPTGALVSMLARRLGPSETRLLKTITSSEAKKSVVRVGDRAVHRGALSALADRIVAAVEAYHDAYPFRAAMALGELATKFGKRVPKTVLDQAAKAAIQKNRLASSPDGLRDPHHQPSGGAEDKQTRDRLMATLEAADLQPPTAPELQQQSGLPTKPFRELLAALVREQVVVHAAPTIYFEARAFRRAQDQILAAIEENNGISTAQIKAMLNIPRKYLIPLVETLDKRGITVRVGELRQARQPHSGK
ncbi:MAG: selenocysteine-specific translation elongation factor [Myxococcota bacterium]